MLIGFSERDAASAGVACVDEEMMKLAALLYRDPLREAEKQGPLNAAAATGGWDCIARAFRLMLEWTAFI